MKKERKSANCPFFQPVLFGQCRNRLAKCMGTDMNTSVNFAGVTLKNPVMTGISGNLGKYITKGVKAITHIVTTQIKAK